MLEATVVTTHNELVQIHNLNQKNLKNNLSEKDRAEQGFVSWLYPLELLEKMHDQMPSIIVKDGDKVVGYALVTIKENTQFHTNLKDMMHTLRHVMYRDKPLFLYQCYFMGQVCIDKEYRGKNIFSKLFAKHYEVHHNTYELLITEIAATNIRSQKAHEKVGFNTIYTHTFKDEVWNVVVWDWRAHSKKF